MKTDELKAILVRYLLGRATEEEMLLLKRWQAESEGNRKLWQKLTSTLFLQRAVGDQNQEQKKKVWKHIVAVRQKRVGRLHWLKVAAAVLLPLLGGMAVWLLQNRTEGAGTTEMVAQQIQAGSSKAIIELPDGKQLLLGNDTVLNIKNRGVLLVNRRDTLNIVNSRSGQTSTGGFHIIRIPWGGEYIARLEDGSVVHLNAGSELKVPLDFGVNNRDVWLKGEAFFDVAHDRSKVFTVHTEKACVSVLGTEFDVRAYQDEEMLTTLVKGSVEVVSGRVAGRLHPGEQARVTAEGNLSTAQVDVYPFIAWKTGRMVFENARLEQIMTELQRWYDFEIFYANPGVKDMRFTIDILKYDDISKVLNLMAKMQKVTFTQQGRTVVLNRR